MDTSNPGTPPIKSRFWEIFVRLKLDYEELQKINEQAGVAPQTIEKMALGDPVSQTSAEKVLTLLSQQMGCTLTLENIDIALLSTSLSEDQLKPGQRLFFPDLWRIHRFRVDLIAPLAQVSEEVIHAMMRSEPVTTAEANRVLAVLSRTLKQEYTLENMFISLLEAGEENAAGK